MFSTISPVSRSQKRAVTAATWGLTSTRGWRQKGWPAGSGSAAKTSSAAPRSREASSRSSRAVSSRSVPRGPPPHARHAHPEGYPTPRDRPADAAQAEHPEPQLRELTHRDCEIGEFRPRPPARRLKLAQAVETASEVADRGDHPIGDWLGMDPGRVGQYDVRPPKMRQARSDPGCHGVGPAERI